ncbi:MAG TPA: NTP transferase domain-containing protein [Candidatus Nanopelagicales bacterium]
MQADSGSHWPPGCTLLVLSGGRSRRLGRDKATTHLGGRPLLDRLLAEAPATVPVVLVGPDVAGLPGRVCLTREEPAGSGPLAGLGAGLALVDAECVGVLAADMPFAVPVLRGALLRLAQAEAAVDAVLPTDPDGQPQPLCAAYRVPPLRAALAGLAPLADRPVRALLAGLRVMEWPVPAAALADVDTAEQLAAARARVAVEGAPMQEWVAAVQDALGLDVAVEVDTILDVARDAAHAVSRPTAPVTTFLLGVAVARGADPTEAAATIGRLAQDWPAPTV